VGLDDADGYVDVLKTLRSEGAQKIDWMRRNGYETVKRHTLAHEQERFADFLERLTSRLDRLGPRVALSNRAK
jgi:hypothetical protein